MSTYQANRGGHAPGHLREAFDDWADELSYRRDRQPEIDGAKVEGSWLIGQLWNCTDIMPSGVSDALDLRSGSYAQGARSMAQWLER